MKPPQNQWQSLPEAALRQKQAEKLRDYLRRIVQPFSAHYRKLFEESGFDPGQIRRFDDLRRIPFTAKPDLAGADPKEFLIIPDPARLARRPATIVNALLHGRERAGRDLEKEFRPVFMIGTTGRSSDPVPFFCTGHDLENLAVAGDRVMRICGARREMRMINLFPFAPHLAFWITHYAATRFGVLTVSSGGGKVMGTEGNLRLMRKLEAEVLIGVPTFLYHVLHEAADEGMRFPSLSKIVLGGEKAPAGMRTKLRDLAEKLGAPHVQVLATYGFTEARMAWAECPAPEGCEPSGYHLNPDMGIVEVIDPATGEPVADGEPGEVVYTPLDARGTVVLRYRTGDLIDGGLHYEPCPHCGRRVPRLIGNISRVSEFKEMRLEKLKGTLVDFNQLEHVLDNSPHIGAWQLEIRKLHNDPMELDELILHVRKIDEAPDEKVKAELSSTVAAEAEIHPNRIIFHSDEEIRELQGVGAQLKEQRLVDHRPGARGNGAPADHAAEEIAAGGKS